MNFVRDAGPAPVQVQQEPFVEMSADDGQDSNEMAPSDGTGGVFTHSLQSARLRFPRPSLELCNPLWSSGRAAPAARNGSIPLKSCPDLQNRDSCDDLRTETKP
jgi:hypothetical protein